MRKRQRIEDLAEFAVPEEPVLSPDGEEIVYVLRAVDQGGDRTVRSLWRVSTNGGAARRLTRGVADTSPAWSRDGSAVAFLRATAGAPQLWRLALVGGEPEQLTDLPLGAGVPVWSPDGTMIAFVAPVDRHAARNEDDAARQRRAEAPLVIQRLGYQADGIGYRRSVHTHLHVLDVESGECRQVTTGEWDAGRPAWSPDSTKIAFAATTSGSDLDPTAPVRVLDLTNPTAEPEIVGLAGGVGGPLTWTAEASALLVVGRTDTTVGHAGLWRIPLDDKKIANLAEPLERNVMPGEPAYPGSLPQLGGDGVLFCARDRGCTHLYTVAIDGGTPRPIVNGAGRVVNSVSAVGGRATFVLTTPDSFGEIASVDLTTGAQTVHTGHGAGDVELFPRDEREFTTADGTVVHGWLIRDSAVAGPAPLLLDIHGGPHNAWNGAADEVHVYHQELATRGWTVLLLNPRASDGYGEEFFTATVGAWGTGDARDFLDPLDQLVAEGLADPQRLAVAGYSYGGFMTCYLTSRDNRFAAAVAGGAVTDLISMAATTDVPTLGPSELGGDPWQQSDRCAEMSPLARVDQVRTPTLLLHGVDDRRCPVGQAEQWYAALRRSGVPTELVLYPGGSHGFVLDGRPSHRIDFNRRIVDWLDRYLTGQPARIDAAHWQRRLTELADKHHVPGATLGIIRLRDGEEDESIEVAHGVLNIGTGVDTTIDSLFQYGSIGKVLTTTVIMRLVEAGELALDTPIAEILPELRLADAQAAAELTMRHLLTHTSGIDGDVFVDTGRGDDCMQRYVETLSTAAQNHPIGATWSYCNSGFVLVGRVIERLTGLTWDVAMRDWLFAPLGLAHTVTLPEEAIVHRVAVGHHGALEPARAAVWLPRSMGPAGLITGSIGDLLTFARLHLAGGLAADGTRLLGEDSVAAMAAGAVELPDTHTLGDSWGLGWCRFDWHGPRLIGHDGNTIGQSAFLRLLPEQGLAVALLANGDTATPVAMTLFREIFAELAGVVMREPLQPPADPVLVDITQHLGTYERDGARLEVLDGPSGPIVRMTTTGRLAEMLPPDQLVREFTLTPIDENLYLTTDLRTHDQLPLVFYTLATGQRYAHFGLRATPKVA